MLDESGVLVMEGLLVNDSFISGVITLIYALWHNYRQLLCS